MQVNAKARGIDSAVVDAIPTTLQSLDIQNGLRVVSIIRFLGIIRTVGAVQTMEIWMGITPEA